MAILMSGRRDNVLRSRSDAFPLDADEAGGGHRRASAHRHVRDVAIRDVQMVRRLARRRSSFR